MKKVLFLSVIAATAVTSAANAGFWDSIGLGSKNPATIEEACDKNEIATVCPETLLGGKTVMECLSQNVDKLSGECTAFVQKSMVGKSEEAKAAVSAKKADATNTANGAKSNADANVKAAKDTAKANNDAAKAKVKSAKAEAKATKDAGKANIKATKNAGKATGKAASDSAKQTGKELKDVGNSIKTTY